MELTSGIGLGAMINNRHGKADRRDNSISQEGAPYPCLLCLAKEGYMLIEKMEGIKLSKEVTVGIIVKEIDKFISDTGENLRTVPLIIFLNYLRFSKETDTPPDIVKGATMDKRI